MSEEKDSWEEFKRSIAIIRIISQAFDELNKELEMANKKVQEANKHLRETKEKLEEDRDE
jgi:hypothetical protein